MGDTQAGGANGGMMLLAQGAAALYKCRPSPFYPQDHE